MQDENTVADLAVRILVRLSNGSVVQGQLWQPLTAREHKITDDEVVLDRSGIALRAGRRTPRQNTCDGKQIAGHFSGSRVPRCQSSNVLARFHGSWQSSTVLFKVSPNTGTLERSNPGTWKELGTAELWNRGTLLPKREGQFDGDEDGHGLAFAHPRHELPLSCSFNRFLIEAKDLIEGTRDAHVADCSVGHHD